MLATGFTFWIYDFQSSDRELQWRRDSLMLYITHYPFSKNLLALAAFFLRGSN